MCSPQDTLFSLLCPASFTIQVLTLSNKYSEGKTSKKEACIYVRNSDENKYQINTRHLHWTTTLHCALLLSKPNLPYNKGPQFRLPQPDALEDMYTAKYISIFIMTPKTTKCFT